MQMREFTLRALLLGLVMTVILGAANAYLGLRAGITIAATYPAAVIGMAVLRIVNGSMLEENIARTAGSIGEVRGGGRDFYAARVSHLRRVAFVLAERRVLEIDGADGGGQHSRRPVRIAGAARHGGRSGSAVSRIVAASEIHKAGRRGADAAKYLFYNLGLGALIQFLAEIQLFANDKDFIAAGWRRLGKSVVKLGSPRQALNAGGSDAGFGADGESRVHRRRLYHRTGIGGVELRGRRAGLGLSDSAA